MAINIEHQGKPTCESSEPENDKLRELAADIYKTLSSSWVAEVHYVGCADYCTHSGECTNLKDDRCWYETQLQELGIEVG